MRNTVAIAIVLVGCGGEEQSVGDRYEECVAYEDLSAEGFECCSALPWTGDDGSRNAVPYPRFDCCISWAPGDTDADEFSLDTCLFAECGAYAFASDERRECCTANIGCSGFANPDYWDCTAVLEEDYETGEAGTVWLADGKHECGNRGDGDGACCLICKGENCTFRSDANCFQFDVCEQSFADDDCVDTNDGNCRIPNGEYFMGGGEGFDSRPGECADQPECYGARTTITEDELDLLRF